PPMFVERRWIVDEMLGRLARYLRFLGEDAAYVSGISDDELLRQARAEERVLITRDRSLPYRTPGSVLLVPAALLDQLGELYALVPELPRRTRTRRCSECNGLLIAEPAQASPRPGEPDSPPGIPTFRCAACGHQYWTGSHARAVDARLS